MRFFFSFREKKKIFPGVVCTRWSFTYILRDEEDPEAVCAQWADAPGVGYLVAQLERAPTTGALHIQGYVEFTERKTIGSIKDLFETGRIHLERSRGTWEQNREYCTKEETREAGPWEYGTHLAQGRRSDLGDVAGMVIAGSSFADIARAHPTTWIRYGKGIVSLRAAVLDQPRNWPADVHVFIGPTETGKSRTAHAEGGESIYVLCDPAGKWWDGYAGQDTVIIDDYRGEIGFTYLLKLLDRYPMQVQTKGGWTNLSAHTWFITSNLEIEDWYGANIDIAPLRRRITEVRHFL